MINMEEAKLKTLVQIKAFLDGTTEVAFRVPKEERNQFIERVFKRFGYARYILIFRADSGNGFSPRSGFVQPCVEAGLRKSAEPLNFTLRL